MPVQSRKWWLLALFAALIAFLLYRSRSLLHLSQFSGAKLWDALRDANFFYLFLAVVLIYCCYFLRAVRWQNLQQHIGTARLGPIFRSTLAGFSAVFLLGRVGEPVRPLLISRHEGVPIADTFGIYALERFIDIGFSVILLAAWVLTATLGRHAHPESASVALDSARKSAGTVLALAIVGLILIFAYVRLHGAAMIEGTMQSWVAAHGWRAAIGRIVLGIARGLKTIRTWGDFAFVLGISALHWFLISVVYYLVALAFGGKLASLPFQDSLFVLCLTLVGSLVQLPGIGGGPQAVAIGAYTKIFDVPAETAVAAAMVLYLVTFAMCTLAGVPLLFKEGLSLGELRRLRAEENEEIDAEIVEHPVKPL
jgi:glycosyltransferase 2 family protein